MYSMLTNPIKKRRITPGLPGHLSSRDPTVEIDLTGKGLTDEYFDHVMNDLLECINFRDEEHPEGATKVYELHIQDNQLTAR